MRPRLSLSISLSSDVERFLETLHFNYPAPDKRNHGWEINFSIPYLPFVLLLIFLLSFSLFPFFHVFAKSKFEGQRSKGNDKVGIRVVDRTWKF